jgi:hypothetical protein
MSGTPAPHLPEPEPARGDTGMTLYIQPQPVLLPQLEHV